MCRKSIGLAVLAFLWAGACGARPLLTVQLSKSADARKAEAAHIDVGIRNTGSSPAFIFDGSLPDSSFGAVLLGDLLDVTMADGRVAHYRGYYAKRIVAPDSFVELAPGAELHFDVDVGTNYDVTNGPGTVSYKRLPYFEHPQDASSDMKPLAEAASNALQVWFNPSLIHAPK
jgi:hypothetical protein